MMKLIQNGYNPNHYTISFYSSHPIINYFWNDWNGWRCNITCSHDVRTDLSKEEMVSTKSACQISIHLMKLPVFLALAFPYLDHALTIGIMLIAVVVGTKIGTELLRRLSTTVFFNFIRAVMFLISIRLFYKVSLVYFYPN